MEKEEERMVEIVPRRTRAAEEEGSVWSGGGGRDKKTRALFLEIVEIALTAKPPL
jgi:hypothetical protein